MKFQLGIEIASIQHIEVLGNIDKQCSCSLVETLIFKHMGQQKLVLSTGDVMSFVSTLM